MGVTNKFQVINDELKARLGYHLDPGGADDFRSLINRAGLKRTRQAIETIASNPRPGRTVEATHKALKHEIWALIPPKTTKYRNPQVQAMKVAEREGLAYAMAKDGD